MEKKNNIKYYIILHAILLVFSTCGIFSKLASSYKFLSFKFILFYALSIFILFFYTIAWQQILKKIPLITAFLNKAITIIWSMLWGVIIFNENITLKMIIGGIIVLSGVSLVVSSNE